MATTTCVGTYLTTRLQQLGVNHLFSVPGDYTSDFLEIVDTQTTITRIGNCNELNAGYAADGYARANGLGAVTVTTGVGSFSLLNAVGGAYVEKVPLVVIIGTLSNTKLLDEVNAGELFHHQVNDTDFNKNVFDSVTVAFERISNPQSAPAQIDAAITACISQSRPVVIEIMEDCYYMPCADPQGQLSVVPQYESYSTLLSMSQASPPNKYALQIVNAVQAAAKQIYMLLKSSQKPLFWIGNEVEDDLVRDYFIQLNNLVQAPFVTALLGKSVMSETDPWFAGMYDGVFTPGYTQTLVSESDCLIGLGVWNTDLNTFGLSTPDPGNPATIFCSRNNVKIGDDLYVQVSLINLLTVLIQAISQYGYTPVWSAPPGPPPPPPAPPAGAAITYDYFFSVLNGSLDASTLVVADIGLSTFGGSSYLTIPRQNGFLCQAIWASIGWSVPAGLGASFKNGTRTIILVGDGAFKLTCQEISTMVKYNCNAVIFVFNNNVYAVEQILLNPAPFEAGSSAPFEAANVLQAWNYQSLMNAFSNNNAASNALSAQVNTVQDLINVLGMIDQNPNAAFLINVNLDERDYPQAWRPFVPNAASLKTAAKKEEMVLDK